MERSTPMSKVVSLGEARKRAGKPPVANAKYQYVDRRRESRSESRARAFVQVVDCEVADLIGTTVSCCTVNISACGLKLQSESKIPIGSTLDIWIDISERPTKFFLSSDVRWSRDREDGSYELGVELRAGAMTDYKEWLMAREN